MTSRLFQSSPSGVEPWIIDKGRSTELLVDIVEAENDAGRRKLGEVLDYQIVLRDHPGDDYSTVNQRYHELLERDRHADQYEVQPTLEGNMPTYTYTGPEDAPLLISLEYTRPRSGASVDGLWGLIEAVTPEEHPSAPSATDLGPNEAALQLSLVYLGHIDEYDDHDDVEETLRNPGFL